MYIILNSLNILRYIAYFLLFSALFYGIYELRKPDYKIEHTGCIESVVEIELGYKVVFKDGTVFILEHTMPEKHVGQCVTIEKGRSGLGTYENILVNETNPYGHFM